MSVHIDERIDKWDSGKNFEKWHCVNELDEWIFSYF